MTVLNHQTGGDHSRIGEPAVPREGGRTRGATDGGSAARRLALGVQLRRLREASRLDRATAAEAIRASVAKISRLERGQVGFKQRDVADLLTLYGVVDDTERAELLDLARETRAAAWWQQQYPDLLPRWFSAYLGLEQACSLLRVYGLQFVPGLLQTPSYAREVIRLGHDDVRDVERRVEFRMRRQDVLTAAEGPVVWAVIDEAALRRPLVSPKLCREQIDHLSELATLPNVQIQVAPLSYGGHPAAGGGFTILRFAEPDLSDVVYLEQLTSALYLDRRADVAHYLAVWDRLVAHVERPDRTGDILCEVRASI